MISDAANRSAFLRAEAAYLEPPDEDEEYDEEYDEDAAREDAEERRREWNKENREW